MPQKDTSIYAVHFLQADMRPKNGREKPWAVGETRTVRGTLELCNHGYHYCHTWGDALRGGFLYGPIACIVKVEPSGKQDDHKGVSATRTLVGAWNVEREMRLFAADEASRALKTWEKRYGKKADPRSWAAVKAARAFADGEITPEDLSAAWSAAESAAKSAAASAAASAAWSAAKSAAKSAAASAAWSAAWSAARSAARSAASAAWSAAESAAKSASARRFDRIMADATGWESVK